MDNLPQCFPFRLRHRTHFPSIGEIRMNVCKSIDLERSCVRRPSTRQRIVLFRTAMKTECGFLGPSGEPFSPLSEKTNIRSKQKVTCLDENAHARPPGAATTGRTEVLLLHDPFVPPTFLRFLFLPFSCPFYPIHRFCALLHIAVVSPLEPP